MKRVLMETHAGLEGGQELHQPHIPQVTSPGDNDGTSSVTIVQDPPVLYTPEGESAGLSCKVREAGHLQILYYHWYLNNTDSDRILENSTRVTIMDTSLTISSVTTNDSGIYICTARDTNLHVYQGNGTRLLVQGPDLQDDEQDPHHHRYLYLLPLPLLILFLYWIFRLLAATGAQTPDTKRREKQRWLFFFHKKDSDTELHYSTIVPKVKGSPMKSRREEEVEYAAVKIAMETRDIETRCMDSADVLYATLRTDERRTLYSWRFIFS
ncbi:uncharacterized protein [Dendropsophus ebraccatus]|uniref:uncharacterized protein n=1 Tax=Dendropsophus ebraccatus TaxID=150705 RepID=UPI00383142D5